MAKKNDTPNEEVDPNARLVTTDADKGKSDKWFRRARELGERRQFDYAIEYYVNGLEFWPDAIEEGCKPLHGCAVARQQTGGKKPGFKDTMKRSLNDKDPKRAYMNALWLFGHDPENFNYIEGVGRNAARLRAEDAVRWAASIALKHHENNPKSSVKHIQALIKLIEELGDRASARVEVDFGVEVYQMGLEALNLWRRRVGGKNRDLENAVRDMSTKLTILKGKYKDGESFRDSMTDNEEQMEIHDRERSVQSDDRLDQLIALADADYKADPGKAGTVTKLVDLLCRRERDTEEIRAIGVLVDQYKNTEAYQWKQAADDIRMKQLRRQERAARANDDAAGAKKIQVDRLRFELKVFRERLERYPTDNRVRFEYAVRSFQAGRFDDAIPLFQAARADPKNKSACELYMGRCFFRKGYHTQAITSLRAAIEAHQFKDDEHAREMHYWLGRSLEGESDADGAREVYGKLLQMDYNYRDVRTRLDALDKDG